MEPSEELIVLVRAMKAKWQKSIPLRNSRRFVVCGGDGCEACFIKKDRENMAATCQYCTVKKYNDKKYAARKEAHKELRVGAASRVNFRFLNDGELKE